MVRPLRHGCALLLAGLSCALVAAQPVGPLPGTEPLELRGDLSQQMVAGLNRFALRAIAESVDQRAARWHRDISSPEAYARSVQPNREHFRKIIGAVDPRVPATEMEWVGTTAAPALLAETDRYTVFAVRWQVLADVHGEGLLLQPKGPVRARVVAVPDADQTPEMLAGLVPGLSAELQCARRLAENGCQVIVPTLIDRSDEGSGNARLNRFTNQPHREWIYRQAFEMGRHVIGYEVQKVLAAIDWFARENAPGPRVPIGVVGLAEGGLIAFHAAALDPRVDATLVAGSLDAREGVWAEPIYRNVFGLLAEFGDAEIASLIAPRALVIAHAAYATVNGPPAPRAGRANVAAPGVLTPPAIESVEREVGRARSLCGPVFAGAVHFETSFDAALVAFARALDPDGAALNASTAEPPRAVRIPDAAVRQLRQVRELEEHTQRLVRQAEDVRQEAFWQKLKPGDPKGWPEATKAFRAALWDDVIGRLPPPDRPPHPRSRFVEESAAWTCHEVVLDMWQDVFAWGYLLVPKDLRPGERRPVVVCQHGLEGLPADTITDDPASRAFGYYQAFAARLAEQGFIVFAPHNPYRGGHEFRGLQRKLNPLGKTLFSVILAQHERILDWLGTLAFVDSARIGFYGLSYGGKTAMRVPALLERYALSICSGDFNEWIRKNTAVDSRLSYMFAPEYEIFEFNLGSTFNYAEMAALIAPRPFMVERGHRDGVATDEWVAYEFAKVRRLYTQLGIPERAAIEFFDGPHMIHGVGTFDFLHEHLRWPKRPSAVPAR